MKPPQVQLCPGINVSGLCYGTLTLGPWQKGLTPSQGARLIRYALERGVTFFDTAELYKTHGHLFTGLRHWSGDVVLATKTYAVDRKDMERSLEKARQELGRDCIDIFLLHEQESQYTLRGHAGALEYLYEAKRRGQVRAVGISTHHVSGVRAASLLPEIDVIHPIINMMGLGIADGTREDMAAAIAEAAKRGKGIYAMKALGGGHLYKRAAAALSYVRDLPGVASIAVGMGSMDEIDANVGFFATGAFPPDKSCLGDARRISVDPWCDGCGECIPACPQECITLNGGKAQVNHEACILCGYCGAKCPNFYIKVI